MTASEIISLIVSAGAVIGIGILTIWSTRQDITRRRQWEEHDKQTAAVERHESRIQALESELRHLPTKDGLTTEFSKLYEKLNEMGHTMSSLKGSQDTLTSLFRDGPQKSRTPK